MALNARDPNTKVMSIAERKDLKIYPNIILTNEVEKELALIICHGRSNTLSLNTTTFDWVKDQIGHYYIINVYSFHGTNHRDDQQEEFSRVALEKHQHQITFGELQQKLENARTSAYGEWSPYYVLEIGTFKPIGLSTPLKDNPSELRDLIDDYITLQKRFSNVINQFCALTDTPFNSLKKEYNKVRDILYELEDDFIALNKENAKPPEGDSNGNQKQSKRVRLLY